MTAKFIPQIEPWIDEQEMIELSRVVKSTYVVEHELTKEFESRIKELTGATHAIAMTNGTAALYCCLKALGIGPGDEVIVPNFTFIATANAVIMAGATPRLCEVRSDTFCIDMEKASALVNSKTKAIMPVHIYGQSADMTAVMNFARQHKIKVIEDAAQGVAVKFEGRHVGTFGELGILSFYGNKTMTCGEGGVVLTEDPGLAKICYQLKNHGREKKGVFIHEAIGFNFSFTEMQAAIGIAQLKKLDRIIERKQRIQDRYVRELSELKTKLEPVFIDSRSKPVFWFTSFLSDQAFALAEILQTKQIQTRKFFYPLHLQPCYQGVLDLTDSFPVSEKIYNRGISLPSSYNLSDADQGRVISEIKAFYAHRH
jgi:perosamine synthetase